jgi:hypothetical protein
VGARLVRIVCAHSQLVSRTRRRLLRGVAGFAERSRDPARNPARAAPAAPARPATLLTLTQALFLFGLLLCFCVELVSDLCCVFCFT